MGFQKIDYVSRKKWGALKPLKKRDKLVTPAPMLIVTWDLPGEKCYSDRRCAKRLQEIQKKNMEDGFPDVRYNFFVANSGSVYEGTGFKYQSCKYLQYYEHVGERIDIAFIGDYNEGMLFSTNLALNALQDFKDYLEAHNYLEYDYDMRNIGVR